MDRSFAFSAPSTASVNSHVRRNSSRAPRRPRKKKDKKSNKYGICRFCAQPGKDTLASLRLCSQCVTRTRAFVLNPHPRCVGTNACVFMLQLKSDEHLLYWPCFNNLMVILGSRCGLCWFDALTPENRAALETYRSEKLAESQY
ncbi:unnamed protein product, partial [Mesorhabditis spiculigera]